MHQGFGDSVVPVWFSPSFLVQVPKEVSWCVGSLAILRAVFSLRKWKLEAMCQECVQTWVVQSESLFPMPENGFPGAPQNPASERNTQPKAEG